MDALIFIIHFIFVIGIIFYIYANSTYLVLLVIAFKTIREERLKSPLLIKQLKSTPPKFAPTISLVAPAYNEEKSIVASVKSFLSLNYPSFEIIVVNDGSKDKTLQILKDVFKLEEENIFKDPRLDYKTIKGTYRSTIHPQLVVVDKENGGKADANNAGIAVARNPIFCAVDSDSILEEDALLRIAAPFFEKPEETVASGGTIRVLNGSTTKNGRVIIQKLSLHPLIMYQNVEYIRAFLCGRVGWNALNATLVISGAFGLFNREAVVAAGGYDHGSIGEDMELVVRLHQTCTELKQPYRVVFLPDPVCWTEVPSDIKSLGRQRTRWQRGLADTLTRNKKLFHPKYKTMGLYTIPYYYMVELWGPVFELLSWSAVIAGYFLGIINTQMIWLFFLIGLIFAMLMTVFAVLIEELYFRKESRIQEFLWLVFYGFIETFGYRQLTSYWRLKGLIFYLRGTKHVWGEMKRKGIT